MLCTTTVRLTPNSSVNVALEVNAAAVSHALRSASVASRRVRVNSYFTARWAVRSVPFSCRRWSRIGIGLRP
jgi:hypothetical protein